MNRFGSRPGRGSVSATACQGVHQIRRFVGERFAASFGDPRFETEVRFQEPMTRWPDRLAPVLNSRDVAPDRDRGLRPRAAAPRPRAADDDRRKRGGETPGNPGNAVITRTKPQTKKPNLYR